MNQVSNLGEPKRRPGGRTADVTERVHRAIVELLVEGGVEACTFSAVAERAAVDRSTLYRRFPERWDAIIDAIMARCAEEIMPEIGDSFAGDLSFVLRQLRDTLETPFGQAVMSAGIEIRASHGGAYPRAYFDLRMNQLAPMFDAAIARGELTPDVDREALFTLAAGPIFFRTFIAGREVDDDFIHGIVSNVCWLHCSPSAAAKLSLPARMA